MMKMEVRLDENLLNAFDALAHRRGTKRSFEIRRLMELELEREGEGLVKPARERGAKRYNVSLTPREYEAVVAVAEPLGMKPTQWTAMLVRRWLLVDPRPSRDDLGILADVRNQIRRIGVNVNQIAQAGNQLASKDTEDRAGFGEKLGALPALIEEIHQYIEVIRSDRFREALYWLTPERLQAITTTAPKINGATRSGLKRHV